MVHFLAFVNKFQNHAMRCEQNVVIVIEDYDLFLLPLQRTGPFANIA